MYKMEENEIGQFIPLHYHFQMLADTSRMTAFREAIEKVVTPQLKVADLGSGTGVLSFHAAKRGAKVWAVEYNPALVSVSRKFITENGVSDRVQIVQAEASSWLPPEPVDVVICEMLHSALLREKQVQVISSFRDAHQERFGTVPLMLPFATLLALQPVWQPYDFDGYHAPVPLFQSPYAMADDCIPCGEPAVYKILEYENARIEAFASEVEFSFQNDSRVNALRFITKSILSIDLQEGRTVDWHSQHLILPLAAPLQMRAGETLRVRFGYTPGDSIEALNNAIEIATA